MKVSCTHLASGSNGITGLGFTDGSFNKPV